MESIFFFEVLIWWFKRGFESNRIPPNCVSLVTLWMRIMSCTTGGKKKVATSPGFLLSFVFPFHFLPCCLFTVFGCVPLPFSSFLDTHVIFPVFQTKGIWHLKLNVGELGWAGVGCKRKRYMSKVRRHAPNNSAPKSKRRREWNISVVRHTRKKNYFKIDTKRLDFKWRCRLTSFFCHRLGLHDSTWNLLSGAFRL